MRSSYLEKLFKSYSVYYDVIQEEIEEPFIAEAIFHSHDEKYFLTRKAQLAEVESHEYVFFAEVEELNLDLAEELVAVSWARGLSRVKPSINHRNSDIVLIILAENVTDLARNYIQKVKRSKNYKLSFHGWSDFQIIVKDFSTGDLILNKKAQNHKKLYEKIF